MTDRNTLLASLRLSDRRLTHTLGVEKAALTIAARHFPALREEEVSAAALLHDCTKEWTAAEQLAFCDSQGIGLDAQEKACVKVLHGRTAAVLAERTFGLPAAVCDAIRRHSTLCERYAPLDAGEALFDALTRAMGTRKEDAQCAT